MVRWKAEGGVISARVCGMVVVAVDMATAAAVCGTVVWMLHSSTSPQSRHPSKTAMQTPRPFL